MAFGEKENRLLKNTVIYMVGNFGSKILTFLIVPLYTHYLSTSEFGTYETIVSILGLISPLCILAIHEGILRWLLGSFEKRGEIISTGASIYLILICITEMIIMIFSIITHWKYSIFFGLLLLGSTLQTVLQFSARGLQSNKVFAFSGIIYTTVMLLLNLVCVIIIRMNIIGMFISSIIASFVSVLYIGVSLKNTVSIQKKLINKTVAKDMLKYSILLVPNDISWWIMSISDRIMLSYMINPSATGIYSIACKFPSIISILHTIFYQAWQEQAVLEYKSEDRDQFYTKVFNTYMKLALCVVLVLIPLSKWVIITFINASYQSGYIYLGLLYLGAIFSSFSGFYGTGYISAKDTKNAMKTTFIGAVVNVVINIILIPIIGIWAACLSTFIGYCIVWIIRVKQTRKYFLIKVNWSVFMILFSLNVIFSLGICFNNLVFLYFMIIFSFGILFLTNKSTIVSIFKKIFMYC